MTITPTHTVPETAETRVGQTDLKLEVITISVSDLNRAKEFCGGLGWRLDADFSNAPNGRSSSRLRVPNAQSRRKWKSPT